MQTSHQHSARNAPVIALTGATGFLGRYVTAALLRKGYRVRMLVRSEPMHEQLPNLEAELVLGDLNNEPALHRLCSGADTIIHLAGAIKAKNRASFFEANARGSEKLARIAAKRATGVPIVYVSSMAARQPELSDYAASKRAGEDALKENASGPLVILRPSAIYGPWDEATKPLFQMAIKGRLFTPNMPGARICLIHARDVAEAVVSAAKHASDFCLYELSDHNQSGYSWQDITSAAAKAVEKEPKVFSVPNLIFNIAGFVSEQAARLIGRTPMLTRGKVREMLHEDWTSSTERQPHESWWQPQISLNEGFKETANWCANSENS